MNARLTGLIIKMFINFAQTKDFWFYHDPVNGKLKRADAKDIIKIADEFKKEFPMDDLFL